MTTIPLKIETLYLATFEGIPWMQNLGRGVALTLDCPTHYYTMVMN